MNILLEEHLLKLQSLAVGNNIGSPLLMYQFAGSGPITSKMTVILGILSYDRHWCCWTHFNWVSRSCVSVFNEVSPQEHVCAWRLPCCWGNNCFFYVIYCLCNLSCGSFVLLWWSLLCGGSWCLFPVAGSPFSSDFSDSLSHSHTSTLSVFNNSFSQVFPFHPLINVLWLSVVLQ